MGKAGNTWLFEAGQGQMPDMWFEMSRHRAPLEWGGQGCRPDGLRSCSCPAALRGGPVPGSWAAGLCLGGKVWAAGGGRGPWVPTGNALELRGPQNGSGPGPNVVKNPGGTDRSSVAFMFTKSRVYTAWQSPPPKEASW